MLSQSNQKKIQLLLHVVIQMLSLSEDVQDSFTLVEELGYFSQHLGFFIPVLKVSSLYQGDTAAVFEKIQY